MEIIGLQSPMCSPRKIQCMCMTLFPQVQMMFWKRMQVASFTRTSKTKITALLPQIQRQQSTTDCGLFSLAFATSLCAGTDPCTLRFDQIQMRASYLCMMVITRWWCYIDSFKRPSTMTSNSKKLKTYGVGVGGGGGGTNDSLCTIHFPDSKSDKFTFISDTQDPENRHKLQDISRKILSQPAESLHIFAHICSQIPLSLSPEHGYHRDCYQQFTGKLDRLIDVNDGSTSDASVRAYTLRGSKRLSSDKLDVRSSSQIWIRWRFYSTKSWRK